MASSCDVQLEDNLSSVSCKDLGSFKYHMGSAFIAMVEMLHALHSLWVSLFPFLMLWWNLMLCATCAKYFSWHRSRCRLLIAGGRRLYGDIIQDAVSFADAEESLISAHQRGLCADACHAEKREKSILSIFQGGSCVEELLRQDPDFGHFPHQRGLHKEDRLQRVSPLQDDHVGVCIQAFPHQRASHKHGAYGDATATCTDESARHLLNQLEELVYCESTSIDSPAEATASHISKLSALSFLDGRGKQMSRPACSALLPHQVPLLDICCYPPNPQKYSWLELSVLRNGDMLHLKVPMLINVFSTIGSIPGQWLQIHSGYSVSCEPALIRGKEIDYATFQLVLRTIGGINVTSIMSLAISLKGSMGDTESRINESSNLSLHESRSSVAYVGDTTHHDNENSDDGCDRVYGIDAQPNYDLKNEDENSGLDNHEDLSSTSLQSDDGCDGVYAIGIRAICDTNDSADVIHRRQCDGHEVFHFYNCHHGAADSGFEDSGDVYGSFVHSNDEVDGLHDCSFHCDVGDDGLCGVEDVDGIYGRQHYDAGDGFYDSDSDLDDDVDIAATCTDELGPHLLSQLDDDVEDNGEVFSDFDFVDDNGLCGNPLEIKELHVAYTWWEEDAVLVDRQEGEEETMEDAVLVDRQEGEEETMEQAWQVV